MRGKNTFSNGLTGRLSGLIAVLMLFFGNMALAQVTFVGNNFNIPVAAGATSGVASGTVAVSCVGQVANGSIISVSINNTHTFEGDLSYWLVAPGGQVLELCTRNGGGNNNFNVTFSDAAATNITAVVATTSTSTLPCGGAGQTFAYNGTYKPEGRNNVVPAFPTSPSDVPAAGTFTFANTFSGINADGNWTLIINDHVGGDAGATCNWSITFAGLTIPSCTFVGAPTLTALNLGMDPGTCASTPINVPAPGILVNDDVCSGFGPDHATSTGRGLVLRCYSPALAFTRAAMPLMVVCSCTTASASRGSAASPTALIRTLRSSRRHKAKRRLTSPLLLCRSRN